MGLISSCQYLDDSTSDPSVVASSCAEVVRSIMDDPRRCGAIDNRQTDEPCGTLLPAITMALPPYNFSSPVESLLDRRNLRGVQKVSFSCYFLCSSLSLSPSLFLWGFGGLGGFLFVNQFPPRSFVLNTWWRRLGITSPPSPPSACPSIPRSH